MEAIYKKGISFLSNTYYKADKARYDIYPEDCIYTQDKVYFSYTKYEGEPMPVGFFLENLENVTLDFNGATLVFHGRIIPFIINNCKNVKIKNVKIDYDRPFYTQGKVIECGEGRMKIKIDEGFRYRVEDGFLYAVSDTWEKKLNYNDCLLWLYDSTGEKEYPIILGLFGPEIFPWENPPLPIRQILVEEDGEYLILKGNFPERWEANDGKNSLLFTHEVRDKCSVVVVNSEDTFIEDFIIIHGASYGVMGMNCKNMYFDNYSMYINYEGNGRLVTNNADGIHIFNCKGEFVLKNSHMEGLLDDTVNIHNNYIKVMNFEGKKLVCKFVGKSVKIDCPIFVKGDRIAIYRGRTQEKRGEYTLEDILLDSENEQFVFTLDKEVENVETGDIAENLSANPTILIENCRFGRFRGTMRLQSRAKTIIRNSVFDNKTESVIFTGDTTYWYESGPVNDFLMENCKLLNTEYCAKMNFLGEVEFTDKEPYYHKNITVRNCYFDKGRIININHVDNFVFEGNTSCGEMEIYARDCGKLTSDENVVVHYE